MTRKRNVKGTIKRVGRIKHYKRGKRGGNFISDAGNFIKKGWDFAKKHHYISDAAGVIGSAVGGPLAGIAAKGVTRALGGSCHPKRKRKHRK